LVSDTYDYFKVITEYASILKEDILNRIPNELGLAKVVFRPDSGDPVKIVCGYTEDEIIREDGKFYEKVKLQSEGPNNNPVLIETKGVELTENQVKGSIECLWDIFGGTVSDKGYKMLNERLGLIYGDSITQQRAFDILNKLKDKGFASNNIVFGVGSYTLNLLSRDCLGMAIKATWAQVDGVGYDIYKDPVTDDGLKKSAKGLLRVDLINGEYVLKDQCTREEEEGGELQVVFCDGQLTKDWTLAQIRERVSKNF
jgi:nicotinamide phosphoribosyltransferase